MKLRYVGESFGVDELTDGKVYECLGLDGGMFRIIDDKGLPVFGIQPPAAGWQQQGRQMGNRRR